MYLKPEPVDVTRSRAVIASKVCVRVSDATIHLVVTGDVAADGAVELRRAVVAAIDADGLRLVVFDLSDATVCGPAGRSALRACRREAARHGVDCRVIGAR